MSSEKIYAIGLHDGECIAFVIEDSPIGRVVTESKVITADSCQKFATILMEWGKTRAVESRGS